MIVDPIPLLRKYLFDDTATLTNDEREILLFALYCESTKNKGMAKQVIDQEWIRSGKVPPP